MKKKDLLIVLSLFLLNFISAQFFGGYSYGRFSLANFFDSIDPSTIIYGLIFFILFTVIFLVLVKLKLFKSARKTPWGAEEPNTVAAGVVSFAMSFLAIYYMYKNGYNLEAFFHELGFSGDLISLFLAIVIMLISIIVVIKFKLPGFFLISGLLLMLISVFTNLIYERGIAFLIGLGLFIMGIFSWKYVRELWKKKSRTY